MHTPQHTQQGPDTTTSWKQLLHCRCNHSFPHTVVSLRPHCCCPPSTKSPQAAHAAVNMTYQLLLLLLQAASPHFANLAAATWCLAGAAAAAAAAAAALPVVIIGKQPSSLTAALPVVIISRLQGSHTGNASVGFLVSAARLVSLPRNPSAKKMPGLQASSCFTRSPLSCAAHKPSTSPPNAYLGLSGLQQLPAVPEL